MANKFERSIIIMYDARNYRMPVAIRFPIPSTVAGDDEEFIGLYCCTVLTN